MGGVLTVSGVRTPQCQTPALEIPRPPSTGRLGIGNGQRPLARTGGKASPSSPPRPPHTQGPPPHPSTRPPRDMCCCTPHRRPSVSPPIPCPPMPTFPHDRRPATWRLPKGGALPSTLRPGLREGSGAGGRGEARHGESVGTCKARGNSGTALWDLCPPPRLGNVGAAVHRRDARVCGVGSRETRREVSLGADLGCSSEYSFWWLMQALSCRGLRVKLGARALPCRSGERTDKSNIPPPW